MSLNVTTLFISLFAAFALFGASLTFSHPFLLGQGELRQWARSTWVMVAGFVALFSRLFLPEAVAIVLGNGLIFVSLFLASQALHQFVGQRQPPVWQLALVVLGWVSTGVVVQAPLYERTAVISAIFAAQILPMVVLIVRRGWHAESSLRIVAVTLGLSAAALITRAITALLDPADYSSYFQVSLGNSLTYLTAFIFPLGAGFSFVLANLERVARRLNKLATYDSLTGCLNRGAFDAMLRHAIAHAQRMRVPISLIVIDLDRFKEINDMHGHQAGDAVLRDFARCARSRLRAGDMFGRIGGDEFGVVLSETGAQGALRLSQELLTTCGGLQVPGSKGVPIDLSASIGIATSVEGDAALTLESFFAQADKALYQAKGLGRNRAELYAPKALVTSDNA